ncbi:hypothetical protein BGZ61DRAFT_297797, partial [Ilyonectria robusta]|uniref:uncharacterized protein n=1 Tax=Ilyonectria robusta TaxID=1079257 RepID=UPI001E8E37EF
PDVKLRTASRKSKNSSRKIPAPETVLHARENHNMVEKQYRNRLKMQFEKLLSVLPMRSSIDDYDDVDAIVSKGEVLDAALRRILWLEEENQQLAVARDQLMKDM